MPVLEKSIEAREIERREEWEDREWAVEREREKRAHELEVARVKLSVPQRHKTITRVMLGLCKAPALVWVALMLTALTLKGKELPKPLCDFMEL